MPLRPEHERKRAAASSTSARLRLRVPAVLGAAAATVGGAALLGAFDGPDEAAAAPTAPIVGHVFRSVSVEQDGRPMPLFDGAPVWLTIERRSFGLYTGCNRMGGPLRVTESRLTASEMFQTAMGCPGEGEQRDEVLSSFIAAGPTWQLLDDRLVLVQGPTTITLEQDDVPPPLPRPNPSRRRDLIEVTTGMGHYQTWPQGIGDSWGGPGIAVAVEVRRGRTYLTMQARCRRLEAPVRIHRSTLIVGTPRRRKTTPCRASGSDYTLSSVRPFFGGTVQWHLDRRRLTLQRDRSTLTLRVR